MNYYFKWYYDYFGDHPMQLNLLLFVLRHTMSRNDYFCRGKIGSTTLLNLFFRPGIIINCSALLSPAPNVYANCTYVQCVRPEPSPSTGTALRMSGGVCGVLRTDFPSAYVRPRWGKWYVGRRVWVCSKTVSTAADLPSTGVLVVARISTAASVPSLIFTLFTSRYSEI